MVLKFIEWYFTVGGFATLLAMAVDYFSGMYVGILVATGRLELQNSVVQEVEPEKAKEKRNWLQIITWTIVMWLTWMYSVPYSISDTCIWLKKIRKETSKKGVP